MKLSKRTRYGLQLLIMLAQDEKAGAPSTPLAAIAGKIGISPANLQQPAGVLRRHGFIHSERGEDGGYSLAKAPEDIYLRDVFDALEGELLEAEEPPAGRPETALERCVRTAVFEPLGARMDAAIAGETLAGLLT
jgi:Rrf2 family protein